MTASPAVEIRYHMTIQHMQTRRKHFDIIIIINVC